MPLIHVIDGISRSAHTHTHTCKYTPTIESCEPTLTLMCGCLQRLMAFAGPLRVFKHSKAACEAEREVEDTDGVAPSEGGEKGRGEG